MRTLIIDGNFLALRLLKARGDLFFRDHIKEDTTDYIKMLCSHLANFFKEGQQYIDNVVLVKDMKSWRKQVPIIRYHEEIANTDYKANRIKSQEEIDAGPDMTEFFLLIEKIYEKLTTKLNIAYTNVNGAEGDDAIWAWTKVLSNKQKYSLVYCTDSDLNMLLNKYTSIYRQVRTKLSPTRGEIMCSKSYWNEFEAINDISSIFRTDMGFWQEENVLMHDRKLGEQVFTPNPYWGVFYKIFAGDSKDNVPPMFSWEKNSRNYKVSERMVEKALDSIFISWKTDYDMLYNDDLIKRIISEICKQTKQENINKEKCFEIVKQNRNLLFLDNNEIPDWVKENLKLSIKSQINKKADIPGLSNFNYLMSIFGLNGISYFDNF